MTTSRYHDVCAVDEVAAGSMRVVKVGATPVVLLRDSNGEFHAMRNACAHMGALLSDGRLQNKIEGEKVGDYQVSDNDHVVRCPWHSYEYDVTSGRCVGDPQVRVKTYQVTTEGGRVLIQR
ncbi:Rieske (2Fe-2S) protein [Amycolatopsis echigonensis]|uniref:Rieske (2Fe-2S) protein n=1 Tax=Amycolatopsis echigonensis TaxID=2576905 RepID=A0A8E1W7N4_9PSEU|nr:Rieske (2Fe-2S) protein [Amycolatopsis echigonensis]MBB2505152.1 Rieske (2Fe-2S) protein [Amycolatopsis echigonensis]